MIWNNNTLLIACLIDFFISVVILLKCCRPKDLGKFMVNCLFPIFDDYISTQQNESTSVKLMELISKYELT